LGTEGGGRKGRPASQRAASKQRGGPQTLEHQAKQGRLTGATKTRSRCRVRPALNAVGSSHSCQ
jgi:hypothetical protein